MVVWNVSFIFSNIWTCWWNIFILLWGRDIVNQRKDYFQGFGFWKKYLFITPFLQCLWVVIFRTWLCRNEAILRVTNKDKKTGEDKPSRMEYFFSSWLWKKLTFVRPWVKINVRFVQRSFPGDRTWRYWTG
jgi:hypothetical protein